jgi:outer membrane protein, heavy metal efflux system
MPRTRLVRGPLVLLPPLFLLGLALADPAPGVAEPSQRTLPSAAPADTLRLSLDEALRLLDGDAGRLAASASRTEAARAAERQAAARPNPELAFQVENLGAFETTSGQSGWGGAHGTLLLSLPMPAGPQRQRGVSEARAASGIVEIEAGMLRVALSTRLVQTAVELDGARALERLAAEEHEGWTELLRIAAEGLAEGTLAAVDVARARAEQARSGVRWAEARARSAALAGEVDALLARSPGLPLRIEFPVSCNHLPSSGTGAPAGLIRMAAARRELAQAQEARVSSSRLPLVVPQLGWRREAGSHALVAGLGIPLPLLDRRGAALEEARSLRVAAQQEEEAVRREVERRIAALHEALAALEEAGRVFDAAWMQALEQGVEAEEAALREGEGALGSLVLARRARVEALESRARWREAVVRHRLELLSLQGAVPSASGLCYAVAP